MRDPDTERMWCCGCEKFVNEEVPVAPAAPTAVVMTTGARDTPCLASTTAQISYWSNMLAKQTNASAATEIVSLLLLLLELKSKCI